MGRPVWVLLPYAPDWRWLLDRDDSPWYPTARLFRQSRPGDWDGVIRRASEALQRHGYAGEVQADRCGVVSAEPLSHSSCNRSRIRYNIV
jgi:hypothetical protein